MDVVNATLSDVRDAIASKAISAEEATQAYLDRIETHNPNIHAYHQVMGERALEQAKAVDRGERSGPLAGVPIAIKDNICTTYGQTTASSKILENYQSPFDATVIHKLEDAGAVVLGKTILDEFAMGSSTEHSAFGASLNPWDTDRVPGGSSGGSTSAVAAGMAAGALGSETGGSIRQPAALCGVSGLKTTYGRISRYGLIAFGSSMDQIGPVGRCTKDLALLLGPMAGLDSHDSTSVDAPVPDYAAELDQPVEKLRIGIAPQYMSDSNHPAVNEAVQRAIDIYKAAGAEVVDIDLPHTEYGIPVYYIVAIAEASSNLARYDGVHYGHRAEKADDLIDLYAQSRAEGFGDEVKRRIMLGTYALCSGYDHKYYLRALKVRRLIKQDFDAAWEKCDIIVCPTTTDPAFKFGDKTDDPLAMYMNDVYTVNANLAGIPAVSVPAGMADVDGKSLPVGLQLIAPLFEESKLLRVARMFEAQTDYHEARPQL